MNYSKNTLANLPHKNQNYSSEYDSHPIYSQMGGWLVDSGNGMLKYKLDKMNWGKKADGTSSNLTGGDGDVMVKIPAFYYKVDYTEQSMEIQIDDTIPDLYGSNGKPNFKIHPAFAKNDGTIRPYFLWGAYDSVVTGGRLRSISGTVGTANKNITQFRDYARQGRDINYGIQSIYEWWAVQMLFYVEFGTLNAQEVLGRGAVDHAYNDGKYPTELKNGMTNSLGDRSGYIGENGKGMMRYRGIENLYGNLWNFIDGFITTDNGYYLTNDHNSFGDHNKMNHISKILTSKLSDGYITSMEKLYGYEFAFIPNQTGGTESSYFCDDFCSHDPGEVNITLAGGVWGGGGGCGVACLYCSGVVSDAWSGDSARLSYSAQ